VTRNRFAAASMASSARTAARRTRSAASVGPSCWPIRPPRSSPTR
jgi:hypothetical protein